MSVDDSVKNQLVKEVLDGCYKVYLNKLDVAFITVPTDHGNVLIRISMEDSAIDGKVTH